MYINAINNMCCHVCLPARQNKRLKILVFRSFLCKFIYSYFSDALQSSTFVLFFNISYVFL